METEGFDSSLSMVPAGTSKVVEQVGIGLAQFMTNDGVIADEMIAITLRHWDMKDFTPGEMPVPIPDELLTEDMYLLRETAVIELLILLYEVRDDIERITGIAHNQGERGET